MALAILTLRGAINVPLVIGLSVYQGLVNAFDMPGRQAFLVEMVENREDLPNAIALNSTMVHGARLVGPAAAGLLIASVGEGLCFLIDALSYIAVIIALLAMRLPPSRPWTERKSVLAELREGWDYVVGFAPIRELLVLLALLSLIGMPMLSVLMPIFGDALSGGQAGAQTLGLLMGASGIGALIGALRLAARKTILGLGRLIALAAGLLGLGLFTFAFSRHLWLSLPISAVLGYSMITTFASANTILQTLAEDAKRGRVMSFFSMAFVGVTPFGNLMAGLVAAKLGGGVTGASRTLMIAGVLCTLAAVTFLVKLPALRRIVRPLYAEKGLLPEVVESLRAATDVGGPPKA